MIETVPCAIARGNIRPLTKLSADQFARITKDDPNVLGVPVYYAEGLGVWPKPAPGWKVENKQIAQESRYAP